MTFVDHFLNFAFYGSLWGICVVLIAGVVSYTEKGNRERRRARKAEARRHRREEAPYPKKTSASA